MESYHSTARMLWCLISTNNIARWTYSGGKCFRLLNFQHWFWPFSTCTLNSAQLLNSMHDHWIQCCIKIDVPYCQILSPNYWARPNCQTFLDLPGKSLKIGNCDAIVAHQLCQSTCWAGLQPLAFMCQTCQLKVATIDWKLTSESCTESCSVQLKVAPANWKLHSDWTLQNMAHDS
jgi:hypothetical protein